jgi:ABC-2 type transport system permease protein
LIFAIVRTAIAGLRRDRPSLALSFLLPIAFFSIFASVFGGQHSSTPRVKLIVVDEDQSSVSRQLVQALERETSLAVSTQRQSKDRPAQTFTAASAEAAVKAGDFPVALIIPHGFREHPVSFGPAQNGVQIQLLNDSSDMIAPQVVSGLLQKAAMTAMPSTMAEQGALYTGKYIGGFTPEQQKRMDENMAQLRKYADASAKSGPDGSSAGPGDSASAESLRCSRAIESKGKPVQRRRLRNRDDGINSTLHYRTIADRFSKRYRPDFPATTISR